jgi:hypothetical protein
LRCGSRELARVVRTGGTHHPTCEAPSRGSRETGIARSLEGRVHRRCQSFPAWVRSTGRQTHPKERGLPDQTPHLKFRTPRPQNGVVRIAAIIAAIAEANDCGCHGKRKALRGYEDR